MVSASPSPNDTTSSPRPRFRQDLVAEPIDELGARFIDVIDPDSGDGFRFYEVEYALACAMDGERDIEGIVRWATEELGLTPSSSEVRTVIATLGELGYLEGGAADTSTSAPADVGETAVTAPVAMPPMSSAAAAVAAAQVPAPSAAHRAAVAAAPRPASPSTPPFARSGSTVPPPIAASAASAASAATHDDSLARGVVVGKTPAVTHEPAGDFELGHVGRAAASDERLPRAPDLALGAPGRVESPRSAPRPPVEDIALGGAGAGDGVPNAQTDMSLDLSDHIAVRPDDVKEAVRQSRVMSAVEMPKDLIDAEPTKAPAPVAAAKPAKADAAPPARPTPQPPQRNTPVPPSIPSTKPGVGPEVPGPAPVAAAAKPVSTAKPAVDLPPVAKQVPANEPAPIAKTAPPAPATRTSPILIALLIVIVIAAAGYVVWRYVLNADDDTGPTTTSEKSTMNTTRAAQTCRPSVPT